MRAPHLWRSKRTIQWLPHCAGHGPCESWRHRQGHRRRGGVSCDLGASWVPRTAGPQEDADPCVPPLFRVALLHHLLQVVEWYGNKTLFTSPRRGHKGAFNVSGTRGLQFAPKLWEGFGSFSGLLFRGRQGGLESRGDQLLQVVDPDNLLQLELKRTGWSFDCRHACDCPIEKGLLPLFSRLPAVKMPRTVPKVDHNGACAATQ